VWQRGPAAPSCWRLKRAADDGRTGQQRGHPGRRHHGRGGLVRQPGELQAEPREPALSRANGRIVFIDEKDRAHARRSRLWRGRDGAHRRPVEAASRGALALGIRSIGTDRERIAHTGAMRYEIGVPRIPAFAVSVPDADRWPSGTPAAAACGWR
jgi:hypothetical protein